MKKRTIKRVLPYIGTCVVFAAMLAWFLIASLNASREPSRREASALRTNIENGITMCYAIEGMYPSSVDYLCEHYGLVYDKDRFIVHYESFASNIRPTVRILERQAET